MYREQENSHPEWPDPTLHPFIPHRTLTIVVCPFSEMVSLVAQLVICLQCRRPWLDPWAGKIPWRRAWQPTSVFLPEESRGRRNLVGYSSWDLKERDTAEQLTLSFFLFFSVKVIYSPCLATTTTHLQRNSFHLAQLKLRPH